MNNIVVDFFAELLTRLFSKSPKFFIVIQWISGVIGFITGIPLLLNYFEIKLPDNLNILESKTMLICALISLIISKLPKVDPPKTDISKPQ